MNLLEPATLLVTGFISCAEFGSYAFVHPVLRRLPVTERITVEQGLLTTFGRVMPIGMTLCVVLAITTAISATTTPGPTRWLSWAAAAAFTAAVAFTIVVNVPINTATGRWDPQHPPADWAATRSRWERFQGVRSWLLLVGLALVCAATTL